jgi:hypothetical protein
MSVTLPARCSSKNRATICRTKKSVLQALYLLETGELPSAAISSHGTAVIALGRIAST